MLIQYLITFIGKTKQEIIDSIDSLNIQGSILVGNQMSDVDFCETIETKKYSLTIYNMKSKGVSRNRNFLLEKSVAEYVTFLDDDMHLLIEKQKDVECQIKQRNNNCVRFNVVSNNKERPIKLLKKEGYVGFRRLSSYGVWGCFFKRQFLIENKLLFNENIGPGTNINHGEDGLFLRDFTKKDKVYCVPIIVFTIDQIESTWHSSDNRNLEKELFSHGYLYYFLYKRNATFMSVLFLLTHKNCFPKKTNRIVLFKYMRSGIHAAKEFLKGCK